MGGFYDANYNITALEKSGGKITRIALNGQDVSLHDDLENNKAATINVASYTAPVEVTPTSGKDGMKKATITLSNIPSGAGSGIYAWTNQYGYVYTLRESPSVGDVAVFNASEDNSPLGSADITAVEDDTITVDGKGTYTRTSTADIVIE